MCAYTMVYNKAAAGELLTLMVPRLDVQPARSVSIYLDVGDAPETGPWERVVGFTPCVVATGVN